jgi:hypothetical protein
MNSPDKLPINLWDKWLKATGVNGGYGYRVPEQVWDAAWNGNWPDDEESIRWILEEYLDVETAKAHGYLELVLPLRETAQAALNAAKSEASEHQRQIKIDADIDEVIKTIQGLGVDPEEKPSISHNCSHRRTRKRGSWLRSALSMIAVAVAALAGFAGGYNVRALNHPDTTFARSPEIRRAIPVEPEIRRAIPVEIRRAIAVHVRTAPENATRRGCAKRGSFRGNGFLTRCMMR